MTMKMREEYEMTMKMRDEYEMTMKIRKEHENEREENASSQDVSCQ